ncbi:MAG: hypothetical protein WKI04_02135 [Ferruginibacter sp.]
MQLPDNDKEFEDRFREAGNKYDASGATPDWDKMQNLLDKHIPARKDPRRRILIVLVILFIFSGGGYWYFNTAIDKKTATDNPSPALTKITDHDVPSKAATAINEPAPGSKGDFQQLQSLKNNNRPQQPGEAIKATTNGGSTVKTTGNTYLRKTMGEAGENDPPAKISDQKASANTNQVVKITGNTSLININIPTDSNEKVISPYDSTNEIIPLNTTEISRVNIITKKTTPPGIKPLENNSPAITNAKPGNKKKNKQSKDRFEFSLVYAPELTTIGFSHIDKPGSSYGFLAGYSITNNIVLQTGLIKSRKNYTANGSEFKLRRPQSPYTKLYKVDGYCIMYEIPLNIKSNLLTRKKYNLFYTAGISSYIMKREFYNYYYKTPYGDSSRSATFNSQNNYWLSLATAGVGFEKHITRELNFGVMPFIKIPFKGMGRGSLKLLGTGINFSLTYKPSLGKK